MITAKIIQILSKGFKTVGKIKLRPIKTVPIEKNNKIILFLAKRNTPMIKNNTKPKLLSLSYLI